jgi:(p)ppGpp synthase/HD superfamily hydrolase
MMLAVPSKREKGDSMILTKKIERAIVTASVLHKDQKRKVGGIPYACHPFSVAFLLSHYTKDEDVIVAGLLHDVLEDSAESSEAQLRENFGDRAISIVREVSEEKDPRNITEDKRATWKKRKEGYIEHLKEASREALLVCAADKIHNIMTFINDYEVLGESIWNNFNASKEESMWFYKKILQILKDRLDSPMVQELEIIFGRLCELTS